MKIRKGDKVIVVSGKDRGKDGKVIRTFPAKNMVVVEGVNIKKKHQRPTKDNQKGQVVEQTSPVHVSNVMLKDPKTNKPTRVGYSVEKGKKVRIAKKSGTTLAF